MVSGCCPAEPGAIVLLGPDCKIDPCLLPLSTGVVIEINGVPSPCQDILNFIPGTGINITYSPDCGYIFDATGIVACGSAAYLCTDEVGTKVEVDLSHPTHAGQLLISQPGNTSAVWADPQVQGLYPAGSPICPAPAYAPPTCQQPIGIGIQDPNGDLQWLQGSYSGSPATFALDVNVVNPLTVEVGGVVESISVPDYAAGTVLPLTLDSTGALYVDDTGRKATYRACQISFVPVADPIKPFFTIQGSATKVIRIRHMKISWACSTGNSGPSVIVINRFTAITGGTFTTVVSVPDDPVNPTVTAIVSQWTTLPTTTTYNAGVIGAEAMQWITNTSTLVGPTPIELNFGVNSVQAITLRGVNDFVGISVSNLAIAGSLMTVRITWTEE
jgi:hypothetical protein